MLVNKQYTAVIIESERGWGQKIDETRKFDTAKERDKFIREFNSNNNEATVPDWYMYATEGKDIDVPVNIAPQKKRKHS